MRSEREGMQAQALHVDPTPGTPTAGTGERLKGGRRTLGVVEVDDGAIVLEEVDLLDRRDVVHAQALERVLQPFVVGGGRLVDRLLLPPHRTLAARAHLRSHLCELLSVHD